MMVWRLVVVLGEAFLHVAKIDHCVPVVMLVEVDLT